MRWPFRDRAQQSPDHRNFSNAAVDALLLSAAGAGAEPAGTAAAMAAVGAIGAVFAVARPSALQDALTPAILRGYAEAMLLRGEWLAAMEEDGTLLPASSAEVNGGASPASWYYDLRFPRASGGDVGRTLPGAGVIHAAWNQPAGAPWRGRSPLTGTLAATALAAIERSLSQDSSITTGMTMAVGAQASDEAIAGVKAALTTGKGRMTVINGMKQAFGLDPGTKGARDYEQLRFGPEIPATSIALRDSASAAVLAAMGVHPALFSGGGEGQREAHRLMVAGTVQALAALLEQELMSKTGMQVRLNFRDAQSVDVRGLGRAVGSFVTAGMSLDESKATVGIAGSRLT